LKATLKPLLSAGSAMRTAGPTTGAAFARLELLDRALDSSAARCPLFGRYDPTNPFVSRQRRQILPGRLRLDSRVEGLAKVRRDFVHGTGFAIALHHHSLP
jgi:hypothetical protein